MAQVFKLALLLALFTSSAVTVVNAIDRNNREKIITKQELAQLKAKCKIISPP